MMSADENTATIRRFVETVWNGHHPSRVGEFHADEFTLNGEACTPATFSSQIAPIFEMLTDFKETVEALVAEGDRVAYRWTQGGTDPRTGEWRSWGGMSMSRLTDGKIVEEWYYNELTDAEAEEALAWLEAHRGERPASSG